MLFLRLAIALAAFTMLPTLLDAQCTPKGRRATPFGPRMTPADSGRVYTSLISPDGREFYFFKRVGTANEDYRLFRSLRNGSDWGSAEPLFPGSPHSDLYPSLSPDGTRLVFSSYRPAPGDTLRVRNAHIWMSRREGGGWSSPEFVPASRLGHYHSGLSQDRSGHLILGVTTPDWRSARTVMLRWNGERYESALVDAPVPPAFEYWRRQSGDSVHVWGAVPGPHGISLVSVSRITQPGGRRSPGHFFVTRTSANGFTPLVRAGGGLGEGSPNFPWFSSDGCYVYYTRDYSEFLRVAVQQVIAPVTRR